MPKQPNPVRQGDNYLLQHFVPVPTVDTPEEIREYYRQAWEMAMVRTAQFRNKLPVHITNKQGCRYQHWQELIKAEEQAKHDFDIADLIVQSFRFSQGNGTLVPITTRKNHETRDVPLTHPGYVHLWSLGKKHNIACESDAHAYESATDQTNHVNCPHCLGKMKLANMTS